MRKLRIMCASLAFTALLANAEVKLPALIGDNMVLQQNAQAKLWGKAAPGKKVTVIPSWNGKQYTTTAAKDSTFMLQVETPAASYEQYSITFDDGTPVTVNDVLVGEVWLASGQSNMQMPLKGFDGCPVRGGYDEIAESRQWADKIRFITAPTAQSYELMDDINARWLKPSPETAQDFSATAWYFAGRLNNVLDIPIGIVATPFGGSRVESWLPREILETYPDVSLDKADIQAMTEYLRPLLMYNAMFWPVKDYTYTGIIWYQGCSNVGSHDTYPERLATMVGHWRDQIGLGEIPFYQVEIAPYMYGNADYDLSGALLREAQWKAAELIPNSSIISTNDLVEPYEVYNIHPSKKADVGKRLGDQVLNRSYGKKQYRAEHPRYQSHTVKDNEVWVAVGNPEGGICRNYDIRGFEVAGPDKVYHSADSVWVHWQTNEIVVSSSQVPEPVEVRYCFRDFQPGTMYGANYLPLVPFRSDDWE